MKETILATLPVPDATHTTSVQLATVVSLGDDGAPSVQLSSGAIVVARLAVPVTRDRLDAAVARQQQTVVVFEENDSRRPIIIGFIEPLPTIEEPRVVEADVDGRRIRITAQDEIVLECGSASVTLRRNGRVVIRGTYVETRSDGTNRIKGGQVQIN